ncbi:MAG: maltose alpha-D-glucosyltransferase [Candidatus Binatia bacterium]
MVTSTLWYKDAIIYELHVRAFCDGNGDGIGDFVGATRKLDYLQELGVTCVWLLPFFLSPLRDDGYDVADYCRVHPDYGTVEDCRTFILAAHERGMRVLIDLVVNHTSDQHPWFRAARSSPVSPKRDYYVWSDTPDTYRQARVIFKDFETSNWTWDEVAGAYYWHRFFSHQPDLNYNNPEVRKEMLEVVRFWLGLGVDGFRCDAVPHLFEREGTSCEGLPETHAYFQELRREIAQSYPDCVLIGEANQGPHETARYFGAGDEFHMAFHFSLVPHLFVALARQETTAITEMLSLTPPIPPSCQWATFLRNHDEMTLSRVTGEERADLYRIYMHDPRARLNSGIRRRLAPLVNYDQRQLELLYSLIFTLPATPVLYYGDEIGMDDNLTLNDRAGLRTPMQWSDEQSAGFSTAEVARLYAPISDDPEHGYRRVNVARQLMERNSLLRRVKRLIAARKRTAVFAHGSLELLSLENKHVLAYLRAYQGETILVLHNLSARDQAVELSLGQYEGISPVDLLHHSPLPSISALPSALSLTPYEYRWIRLVAVHTEACSAQS